MCSICVCSGRCFAYSGSVLLSGNLGRTDLARTSPSTSTSRCALLTRTSSVRQSRCVCFAPLCICCARHVLFCVCQLYDVLFPEPAQRVHSDKGAGKGMKGDKKGSTKGKGTKRPYSEAAAPEDSSGHHKKVTAWVCCGVQCGGCGVRCVLPGNQVLPLQAEGAYEGRLPQQASGRQVNGAWCTCALVFAAVVNSCACRHGPAVLGTLSMAVPMTQCPLVVLRRQSAARQVHALCGCTGRGGGRAWCGVAGWGLSSEANGELLKLRALLKAQAGA